MTLAPGSDRKSTRLNSSHLRISYAVFCLKKVATVHTRSAQTTVKMRDKHMGRSTHAATSGTGRPNSRQVGKTVLQVSFFFNDTATTEIYALSLHDALPICIGTANAFLAALRERYDGEVAVSLDRKSTRLNSSHLRISYAVFCLKKTKIQLRRTIEQHTTHRHCHST